jgi:hypothetical protein
MLNCFSGVFTLTATHKVDGNNLFVVARCGDDVPTLCFTGKQKETILKWGKPNRMVAVSGAIRTQVVNKTKMTFVEVAYSRFLDKAEEAAVKETVAPVKAAKAAPKTETKASAKAAEAPATSPVNDEVPW